MVQQWLHVIWNREKDLELAFDSMDLPFSFDGEIVADTAIAKDRLLEMRQVLNWHQYEAVMSNYNVLTKAEVEEHMHNHASKYNRIADRVHCMVAFDLRVTFTPTGGQNIDRVYVGLEEHNKVMSFVD